MITAIVLVAAFFLVEAAADLSARGPLGRSKWTWWELTPTPHRPNPALARGALARPSGIGWRRSLTIVRVREGSRRRVWVSFVTKGDDANLVAQLAAAAGCTESPDASVPEELTARRWRESHITPSESRPAKLNWNDADGLAGTIDRYLADGEAIVTTVRWTANRQIKARSATNATRLSTAWTHEASTTASWPLPSPLAIVPLLVLAAAGAIGAHSYFELPAFLDTMMENIAGSPSTPVAVVALVVAAHSTIRLTLAITRPRLVGRARRFWHLPLGWRAARSGGTVSVEQLSGWARARP